MELIVPHMRHAFRITNLVPGAQGTLSALMELHPHGVFLIDAGGRIVLANRRGEGLLRRRDGLLQVDGRLSAMSASGQEALARAIHIAVLTGLGTGVHPGQALTIDRPSGASPHQVLVTPLHQPPARFGGGPSRICAAVFVADRQSVSGVSSDALREWFGLTPAEARVALAVTDGLSVKEIAERSASSSETVRNQLKTVFSKVGVHRQAELVRLLLGSAISACDASTEQDRTGS